MDWDQLADASGDGRGRKNTTIPRLEAAATGEVILFGPYKSKASAGNSMKTAQAQADENAIAVVLSGPRGSTTTGFYFRAVAE